MLIPHVTGNIVIRYLINKFWFNYVKNKFYDWNCNHCNCNCNQIINNSGGLMNVFYNDD